jgi:hypothetical protein
MDKWRQIFFQATGQEFCPGSIALAFSESFEAGAVATFGGHRGDVVGFGGALYRVPDDLPQAPHESQFEVAFAHLAQLLPVLREAGATKFILHMHRTFQAQCNEEFTQSELRMLVSLDCLFFYAARTDWDVHA